MTGKLNWKPFVTFLTPQFDKQQMVVVQLARHRKTSRVQAQLVYLFENNRRFCGGLEQSSEKLLYDLFRSRENKKTLVAAVLILFHSLAVIKLIKFFPSFV